MNQFLDPVGRSRIYKGVCHTATPQFYLCTHPGIPGFVTGPPGVLGHSRVPPGYWVPVRVPLGTLGRAGASGLSWQVVAHPGRDRSYTGAQVSDQTISRCDRVPGPTRVYTPGRNRHTGVWGNVRSPSWSSGTHQSTTILLKTLVLVLCLLLPSVHRPRHHGHGVRRRRCHQKLQISIV